MKTAVDVLKEYWGYDSFRPKQEDIIQSVISGKDTLALLPTGGGKSICFQVPAMMKEGICIVISPLIALMRDQVDQLRKKGIVADAIYSGMKKREIDIVLDNCIYGKTKFLYVSPERLKTELFLARAQKMNINLLAVDEAHCISQWGYDFRPSYLVIQEFKQLIAGVPTIALTASATKEVQEDIVKFLGFDQFDFFQNSFSRKNLSYSVFQLAGKEQKMLEILNNVKGSAIVYVSSRRKTIDTAIFLQENGVKATYYHGGLSSDDRIHRQKRWIDDQIRVMVSTNAFGMGIDKPNVRCVIHLDIPDSIEAYYQEAGRAGRDEYMAYAVLLYNKNDLESLRARIMRSAVPVELLKRVYQSIANHLKIAVGSHSMESFEIDISELIRMFDLPGAETYYALKKLGEEGLMQFSEGTFKRSKIHILLDKSELYKFQVANAPLDPVIKVLLRLYGGDLFTNYVQVKEEEMAKLLAIPNAEVIKKIKYLDQIEVIAYDQQSDKPRLTFLTPRQDAARLTIDKELLDYRNGIIISKMEQIISFLTNEDRCRTQQIQEYFGEISYVNCNVCDYCLREKRNKDKYDQVKRVRDEIMSYKGEKTMDLFKFRKKLNPTDQYYFSEALRELLEEGKIQLELDVMRFL